MERRKNPVYKIGIYLLILFLSLFAFIATPRDLQFEKAATAGVAESQFLAGQLYLEREYTRHYRCSPNSVYRNLCSGIIRLITGESMSSLERAEYWLQLASDQAHPEARYLLATLLLGEYTPTFADSAVPENNPELARQLLEKATVTGHVDASYKLGWSYLRGIGGNKNLKKAIQLLEYAADNKHKDAPYLLKDIHSQQSTEEIVLK